MYKIIACLVSILAVNSVKAQESISEYLQSISVTIHANGSQGSGVIKTRGNTSYVWTAAHVVSDLKTTRKVIDKGNTKTIIEFKDAKIVTELIEEGRSVGKTEMDAEVIRYSDFDSGEDLALLRIRKKDFTTRSMKFYTGSKIIPVGTELIHVGSLHGQMGSNSVTTGILSQHGRVIDGKVYDQSTCAAFPGSSGGGVYLKKNGQYVGMIVRGSGETFNFIVPIRRMNEWAKSVNADFAIDDEIPVPSEKELKKNPVEDSGFPIEQRSTPMRRFPFLVYKPLNILSIFPND